MSTEQALDRRYDVVIVGARAAGAATAMLLARTGLKVLAVDRQPYGSDTLSTHALMRGAVVQLARWSLLDSIVRMGTPKIHRTTFHYGDESIGIEIKPDHGIDALIAPRRNVLDRALVDGARAAGADIRHGTELVELEYGANGRVIGASIRGGDGVVRKVSSDLVVGADGRRSMVAKSVAAKSYRQSRHYTSTVYGYFSGLEDSGFRWYYRPGVSAGAIPTNERNTCVFVSLPPHRYRREKLRGPEAAFNAVLVEASPALAAEVGQATRRSSLRGFSGEAGYFRQSFGPGWALVGDAGYFKDPLTAHGITDALRDAELLASAVVGGSEPGFRRYQTERDSLSTALFDATDDIASFTWDLEALNNHHRKLNKAMKAEAAALAEPGKSLAEAA